MTTKRQLGWQKLLLIVTVLPCCWSLEVSIPEPHYEAPSGGDISLPCTFDPVRPITDRFVLTWDAYPDTLDGKMKSVASFFKGSIPDIAPDYEGRASLTVDFDGQISTLHLTKLTAKDSRRFQCSVLIPDDNEGTTEATTSLTVLVPPSPPVCKIQGKAEYGHNISLTCMSEEGSPTPVAQWKSFSTEHLPRPFPAKTTEKDGVLSLFNISRETSGFFVCTSTNRVGSASCNLTLAVMPGSMNIGSTAVIIGGVVAGLALVGILIFCCCCRKKGKKDESAEGAPEGVEFHDRDGEAEVQYKDEKPNTEVTQVNQREDKDIVPQKNYSVGVAGHKLEDDQRSNRSGKEGKGSDNDSRRYQDGQDDRYRGSRDRLDENRNCNSRSRDRLDDQRDRYGGSRDRLDDQRDRYGGSRDRLDDKRDRYGGSRDRLDDTRDRYGGSRDRLDDRRDRYGGSRDRLDDTRDRYGGSRDRLDDTRDRYGGSRDRLDDRRDRYGGSRDRLDDTGRDYGYMGYIDDQE